jgi:hypothetical protein
VWVFKDTLLCSTQGVELRSPAKEGSDLILTSYYYCYWNNNCWNGYRYVPCESCYVGSYNYYIPGTPTSIPSEVAIRDESSRIVQVVGADCPDWGLSPPTGPTCQGSGLRPYTTDAPPTMLGVGPCELPFIEWQVPFLKELVGRHYHLAALCLVFGYISSAMHGGPGGGCAVEACLTRYLGACDCDAVQTVTIREALKSAWTGGLGRYRTDEMQVRCQWRH